ncbi:MAG: glycoside hydrolase family 97 N-terminal domain-containing protein, partial [Pseudomonadota bacterium]
MRIIPAFAAPLALTLSCALVPAAFAQDAGKPIMAASPDGSLVVSVSVDNDGRPVYTLTRKGKLLVGASMLGFIVADGPTMARGNRIIASETGSGKETWEQPWGERRFVVGNLRDGDTFHDPVSEETLVARRIEAHTDPRGKEHGLRIVL